MTNESSSENPNHDMIRSPTGAIYFVATTNPPQRPSAAKILFKNPSRNPRTMKPRKPIIMTISVTFIRSSHSERSFHNFLNEFSVSLPLQLLHHKGHDLAE